MLGIDIDDVAYIPVATAMRVFNLHELLEIDVLYDNAARAERRSRPTCARCSPSRHGEEDFTVTTQKAMLEVFGNVMDVITMSVGAIAGISLLVGAIGILTMMWIAVGERTARDRPGARLRRQPPRSCAGSSSQRRRLLGIVGGLAGLAGGLAACALLRLAVPGLPVHTPGVFIVAAIGVSLATGLLSRRPPRPPRGGAGSDRGAARRVGRQSRPVPSPSPTTR